MLLSCWIYLFHNFFCSFCRIFYISGYLFKNKILVFSSTLFNFSFSCLLTQTGTSSMLIRSNGSGHSCLVTYFRWTIFSMMLAVGFWWKPFSRLSYFFFISQGIKKKKIGNGVKVFVKCFFCIYWDYNMIFLFSLLLWWITLIFCPFKKCFKKEKKSLSFLKFKFN